MFLTYLSDRSVGLDTPETGFMLGLVEGPRLEYDISFVSYITLISGTAMSHVMSFTYQRLMIASLNDTFTLLL